MSYALLEEHFQRLSRLRHVEAVVSWDEATMMSAAGGPDRADALATLRGVIHERLAAPHLGDWFAAAAAEQALDPWQRANLREMHREWERATALEPALVETMARAESACEQAWRSLRPANDYAGFLPLFREVVRRKRDVAQALGDKLALDPYDALLEGFEPGLRTATIVPLFSRLREFLQNLIPVIVEGQRRLGFVAAQGPFPEERQRWLGLEIMRRLGFDFTRGRLDKSHHPFCAGVPTDVRITTRYDLADYTKSIMSLVHETGHARYEQGLPAPWRGQPVGNARSTSMHEGQSLFFEMQIARSKPFIELIAPLLADAFPGVADRAHVLSVENLYRQITRVVPGLIRGDADEATYPCHIILRFELERRLIAGTLRAEDVPQAWGAGMRDLLGISSDGNDRDGCMQDVHWPAGLFGYFPAYTLGALTAAQLAEAANRAIPELDHHIQQGDFRQLDDWLSRNIWAQASFYETGELLARATGRALGTDAFEAHVRRRYLG